MNKIGTISIITPLTYEALFEITACVSDIMKHPIEEVRERFYPGVEHQTTIDNTNIITRVNYAKDMKSIEKITFRSHEVK